mmetsp:Transcript_58256/g.66491  ORF Transcript_58256/g.66491 Transcript_58256/m.66491 type:complete len:216 (-) Transcript_58256:113-760(-)
MAEASKVVLFSYWRSSCSWRLRIALNMKGIEYEYKGVHLVKDGGEQHNEEYKKMNPAGLVPTLCIDGHTLTESIAVMEYLDETRTENPLLPKDSYKRMQARQLCQIINSGTQPIQNLRILQKIEGELGGDKMKWGREAIENGLKTFEETLKNTRGKYCVGDEVTMADICLVPQLYNAGRFSVDMTQFPNINEVHENLKVLKAFEDAIPENQPDAV